MATPIQWLDGVGDELAAALGDAGFDTAEAVREADTTALLAVDGIGPTRAAQLADAEITAPPTDTVAYRFECDAELWNGWKATLDDDIAIDIQLRSLLRREAAEDNIDPDGDGPAIAAIQARKHCMRAMQSVADDNQAARDELSEIMRLMDAIVG